MNLVSKYSYIELCNLLIGKIVNFKSDCQLFDNFDVTGKVININISKTNEYMIEIMYKGKKSEKEYICVYMSVQNYIAVLLKVT